MQKPYITIEGNIGAGKTTFAHALAQHLGAHLLLEEFENNEALKDFYTVQQESSKNQFALAAEMQFLLDRYRQQQRFFRTHSDSRHPIVSDYLPHKSLLFAEMNLDKHQFEVYHKTFDAFMKELPQPNLIVYLEVSPEELLANIKKRGRTYEQKISLTYLEQINHHYKQLLQKLSTEVPVIVFSQANEYQAHQQEAINKIVETINAAY